MHMHLNFAFKQALHFSTLAIQPFYSGHFKLQLQPQHYQLVFF